MRLAAVRRIFAPQETQSDARQGLASMGGCRKTRVSGARIPAPLMIAHRDGVGYSLEFDWYIGAITPAVRGPEKTAGPLQNQSFLAIMC
jgi:hypothetical protein